MFSEFAKYGSVERSDDDIYKMLNVTGVSNTNNAHYQVSFVSFWQCFWLSVKVNVTCENVPLQCSLTLLLLCT